MPKYFEFFRALRQPPVHAQPSAALMYNYVSAFEAHVTDLDTEFTIHDIEQALATVKSGKAADCYGDVAKLFTRAKLPDSDSFLLAPHLTRIFNAISVLVNSC